MGQNFAGYIAFSVNARQGQRLILRFGEMLMDGELTQDNFQLKLKSRITPKQEINYTCCEAKTTIKPASPSLAISMLKYQGMRIYSVILLMVKPTFQG